MQGKQETDETDRRLNVTDQVQQCHQVGSTQAMCMANKCSLLVVSAPGQLSHILNYSGGVRRPAGRLF